MEENGTFSLFNTSVNGKVTFAFIMTFHCTCILCTRTSTKDAVKKQVCIVETGYDITSILTHSGIKFTYKPVFFSDKNIQYMSQPGSQRGFLYPVLFSPLAFYTLLP